MPYKSRNDPDQLHFCKSYNNLWPSSLEQFGDYISKRMDSHSIGEIEQIGMLVKAFSGSTDRKYFFHGLDQYDIK